MKLKQKEKLAKALKKIGTGFYQLAQALEEEDEEGENHVRKYSPPTDLDRARATRSLRERGLLAHK